MTSKSSRRYVKAFGLAVFAALLAMLAVSPFADKIDRLIFDEWIRLDGGPEERDDFVFLGIDEASMDLAEDEVAGNEPLRMMTERWPWDRRVWAHVIERLGEAGARLIVVDLIFSSPSDPKADAALEEAISKYRDKVILTSTYAPVGQGPDGNIIYTLVEPIDWFMFGNDGETTVGYANFSAHPLDGVRRVARYQSSIGRENGKALEGEPWQTSLAGQIVKSLGGELPDGEREILFSSVNGDGSKVYAPYSIYELFLDKTWEQNFDRGKFFENKVVMIGPAAPRFQDIHPTPVGPMSGPQLHLQAAACAMSGAYLQPMNLSMWITGGFVGLMAFLVSLGRNVTISALSALLLLVLVLVLAVVLAMTRGVLMPATIAGVGIIAAWLSGQTYHYLLERREKLRLHSQFRRFVSKDVADRLVSDPDKWARIASGESRQVVVLFSDVRGFTSRSEMEQPEKLVRQLNEYLTKMVEVVFRNGGTLDKFIGDAVMAHWGALGEGTADENARAAIKTSREMMNELALLNARWKSEGYEPMTIGIGLHIGDAIAGELGSPERTEFGVIGDAVNLASRLEGLTKMFGADVVYSGDLRKFAGNNDGLELGVVRVKGRKEPVMLYAEGDEDAIRANMGQMERDSDGVLTFEEK